MLYERQKVSEHNHEALGWQGTPARLYAWTRNPICAGHCQQWPGPGLESAQELHFLLHPRGEKKVAIMTKATHEILLFYESLHCADAQSVTGQQAFNGHVCPFKSLSSRKDIASTLPLSSAQTLPIPLFLMKATLRLSLVKGQCFHGRWGTLLGCICIWSKTFEMCTKGAKSEKEKDSCIKMSQL